jgi:formate/nitrite transporter FocA (FNT family)
VATAPTPAEIFHRAAEEGGRRLDQSTLELVSTSFIAGFTIVFGLVALGIVHALVKPRFGEVSQVAGALAFGIALVFLVVGRAELFNENFADPVARAAERSDSWLIAPILRLWALTFLFNFVGGFLFALVFAVPGVLPPGAAGELSTVAEEIVHRTVVAEFASGIVGGALVSLMSFLLQGVNTIRSRITIAYIVGFLLALGPFDHVVVTTLHVLLGLLFDAAVSYGALAEVVVISTAGNLVGGLGLVVLTHITQARGAEESND